MVTLIPSLHTATEWRHCPCSCSCRRTSLLHPTVREVRTSSTCQPAGCRTSSTADRLLCLRRRSCCPSTVRLQYSYPGPVPADRVSAQCRGKLKHGTAWTPYIHVLVLLSFIIPLSNHKNPALITKEHKVKLNFQGTSTCVHVQVLYLALFELKSPFMKLFPLI